MSVSEFGYLERVVHQALSYVRINGPTRDLLGEQVKHAGHKHPALFCLQIRDVAKPHLIGRTCVGGREVLLHRFGAIGSACAESVVSLYLRSALALNPMRCIGLRTRNAH